MEYKITNTVAYLLIVDESEIKEGQWGLNKETNDVYNRLLSGYEHKIIAHLPLGDSAILPGVDLLPPLEDEVEKFVEHHLNTTYIVELDESIKSTVIDDYKAGYNKAKEKYKYTEKDMKKAFEYGKTLEPFDSFEDLIQSLQQPKMPVGFKRSVEILNVSLNEKNISFPAKITNSQGLTQWVGEYIY